MQIRVLLFASARDRAGAAELVVDVNDDATARAILDAAVATCPALASLAPRIRVAVNHAFVDGDARISPGDEVALLPPVSGGSHGRIVDEALDLARVIARVVDAEHGAVATFTGLVRRSSHGHVVTRLDYEAYVPMAERELAKIISELEATQPVRVAIEHRVGALAVGDLAVVIAVGSAHRREALVACADAIDAVKARVPIWKREHTAAGAEWVGCDHLPAR